MTTIRAAVLRDPSSDTLDFSRLAVEDVELAGPGPGEVLLEVAYASLCHSDLSVLTGDRPRPLPMVLGHEASGRVRAIGPGVTGFGEGDHVVCTYVASCGRCGFCRAGRPVLCSDAGTANAAGTLRGGGSRLRDGAGGMVNHHLGISAFAEYAVVDAASLVPLPADIPLRDAALFGCAVTTGVGAVVNSPGFGLGRSAAVIGCGGVGLAALLGLRAVGAAPIIAVDTRAPQLELAGQLAADHTVLSGEDSAEQVRDLTRGAGVESVIEASGTVAGIELGMRLLRRGGQLVMVGLPNPAATWTVHPAQWVADDITVRGSYMGSSVPSREIPRFIELYRAGRLPVDRLVTDVLPLAQVSEGMAALHSGSAGRIVLEVAGG